MTSPLWIVLGCWVWGRGECFATQADRYRLTDEEYQALLLEAGDSGAEECLPLCDVLNTSEFPYYECVLLEPVDTGSERELECVHDTHACK